MDKPIDKIEFRIQGKRFEIKNQLRIGKDVEFSGRGSIEEHVKNKHDGTVSICYVIEPYTIEIEEQEF